MSRKRAHRGKAKRGKHSGGCRPGELLTGIIYVARPGMATVETAEGSFPVAPHGIREAMNGDEVQVSLRNVAGGGHRAYVQSVLQRATEEFLGIFSLAGPLGEVTPLDGRICAEFFVTPEDSSPKRLQLQEGDLVQARVLEYPTRHSAGVVTVDRKLGPSHELDLSIERVIASHGLWTEFTPAARAEAESMAVDAEAALEKNPERLDLRKRCVITIDPADARDFDDAVEARATEEGFELWVHIADVTEYVGWNSSIDLEARRRTCSTYLVDRVIPMLPERLSNNVCSLRPGEDRLCMSVHITLNRQGDMLAAEAAPSVICSRARLAYEEADALLEGSLAPEELPCKAADAPAVAESIRLLDHIAQLRQELRRRRGAVDFETREAKVLLNEKGEPRAIKVRRRTRATNLIEEAMLLANEAVAKMVAEKDLPCAYRVHERPLEANLQEALPVLRELGLVSNREESERLLAADPFAIQSVLERAQGTAGEWLANTVLLRAQSRAIYLPQNDGHYALGATAYCHFTSPIRRYPDMLVHRALKAQACPGIASILPQLCRDCSEKERIADIASRQSQKIKMAEYYAQRIGQRFVGIVVGVEHFGLFIMIETSCAEGLLPARHLGEDGVESWQLGQRLMVEVSGATPEKGYIDFCLPER